MRFQETAKVDVYIPHPFIYQMENEFPFTFTPPIKLVPKHIAFNHTNIY